MKILRASLFPFIVMIYQPTQAQAVNLIQEQGDNYNQIFQSENPAIAQEKLITINTDFLFTIVEDLKQIKIMLFDGLTIVTNQEKVIHDVLLSDLWVGSVPNDRNRSVILAISPVSISGTIKLSDRIFSFALLMADIFCAKRLILT
ncbi:hypothetical protein [Spartinivicinus ruber]|uniref:hypothetical protein n=1 Tax=Spartinivicinus ruber TaxID=2683272 RepID=UPI0013CF6098|nr:hypothetical protein [Spartinivicinus ruber]